MTTRLQLAQPTAAPHPGEEGQTMAEYGVALGAITLTTIAVLAALSGGIAGAASRVVALLPA